MDGEVVDVGCFGIQNNNNNNKESRMRMRIIGGGGVKRWEVKPPGEFWLVMAGGDDRGNAEIVTGAIFGTFMR